MSLISPPPNQLPIDSDQDGIIDPAWKSYFTDIFQGVYALQSSGTTAQRPTKNLFAGRTYFDTSLGANGKPIWRNKGNTGWVLADGTAA